jgi:hypothetical protein
MRHDFDAIPEPEGQRVAVGSMLTQMYHDIGLAAVADALDLCAAEFDANLAHSIERGEFYLIPMAPRSRSWRPERRPDENRRSEIAFATAEQEACFGVRQSRLLQRAKRAPL